MFYLGGDKQTKTAEPIVGVMFQDLQRGLFLTQEILEYIDDRQVSVIIAAFLSICSGCHSLQQCQLASCSFKVRKIKQVLTLLYDY